MPYASRTLLLLVALAAGCASEDYIALYYNQPVAPSLTTSDIESMDYMGPILIDEGVNFCVYSEHATRIELALFDDPESNQPSQQFPMTQDGNLWTIYVEGVGVGQHYGYIAWGPNWTYDESFYPYTTIGFHNDADLEGNRFNPNKLLTDPYAKAYHRDHDWSKGSVASGPWAADATYAAASKSVVVESDYAWSENEEKVWRPGREDGTLAGHDWKELILYEVHTKGFTANPTSGVDHPGTFRGLAEKADYLQDLGINAIELLPVTQKETSLGGYWGYSNLSYFAPENNYSDEYGTTKEVYDVLDEFKEMVDTLHQHDIEVIIDVVFNHTGEGGLWEEKVCYGPDAETDCYTFNLSEVASLYDYRGLDNAAYYQTTNHGQEFIDHTGVGQTTRANYTPFRRMILDSLHFWSEEMHVDGFRFDLAAVLGEVDGDSSRWDRETSVLNAIINDADLQGRHTRIIAEPWSMGSYSNFPGGVIGEYPASGNDSAVAWSEWNGAFRDWWRRFMNWDYALSSSEYGVIDGGGTLTGSSAFYSERNPYNSVNFVTCHDGYTMYDLFSFDSPRNACGPLNPVCCSDPYSVWCDLEDPWNSSEKDWSSSGESYKRQLMRNLFVAMLVSRGTPMLYGGDEWLRTQFGNNNAYAKGADNAYNWFRWSEWQNVSAYQRLRMYDFVKKLIQLRKDNAWAFEADDWNMDNAAWLDNDGSTMAGEDWNGRHVGLVYSGEGRDIAILINQESSAVTFNLGGSWALAVDTQSYFDTPATPEEAGGGGYFEDYPDATPSVSANIHLDDPTPVGSSYTVVADSIVVLVTN